MKRHLTSYKFIVQIKYIGRGFEVCFYNAVAKSNFYTLFIVKSLPNFLKGLALLQGGD